MIFIDDASTDNTLSLLNEIYSFDNSIKVFSQSKNLGKGAALKRGISISEGDILVFCDADLELDPYDLPLLLNPLMNKSIDVVNGSRYLNETNGGSKLRVFF
jgi:glycosyltransferase involved in cell wall biosynthesis